MRLVKLWECSRSVNIRGNTQVRQPGIQDHIDSGTEVHSGKGSHPLLTKRMAPSTLCEDEYQEQTRDAVLLWEVR